MRILVPTEGKRPSQTMPLAFAHFVDNVEQFLLDFIGNLIRKKGDDGDVSASRVLKLPFCSPQLAPAAIGLHGRVFVFSDQDGKISKAGMLLRETTQDKPTI